MLIPLSYEHPWGFGVVNAVSERDVAKQVQELKERYPKLIVVERVDTKKVVFSKE